ncbi:hypothetical protein PPYR_00975 [Photinus pyralis]|uniref:Uncharacterized protein n=1 Tax=Photinus pyralis TaxID=7054 RepID=A0A5N4B350_PHOPY|nr:proline-rich protein 13-like [Photinus pyralis]KAB0804005.1 hypothetical protein PPYR_00975 [Photinus pyralis]
MSHPPPNQYGMHPPPGQPPPVYPASGSIYPNLPHPQNFGPPPPYHSNPPPQPMGHPIPQPQHHTGHPIPQYHAGQPIPQPQYHAGQPIPYPSSGVPQMPVPGLHPQHGYLPPPGLAGPLDSHHQKKLKKKELKKMMKMGIPIAGATAVGAYGVSKMHKHKKHKHKSKHKSSSSSSSSD